MSAFSRPAKFILIGSAALLLLAILISVFARTPPDASAVSDQAAPPSDGWICQWLDTPTLQRGTLRNQCHGVVQCRHPTMLTFVPQIRTVTCRAQGNACDPAACFSRSISTP